MSSVRKRNGKCWARTGKGGNPYVVCNDPPNGSKGQAGVYQAENPTGKQDGRSKVVDELRDKARARNRVRKTMMTANFQKNFGDGASVAYQRVPKSAPDTADMDADLMGKGASPTDLFGMGRLYVYTRWANETKEGKAFIKKEKLKKPDKFAGVDDRDAIKEAAEDIVENQGKSWRGNVEFNEKNIDNFPIRAEYDELEEGKLSATERIDLQERALRYKHYLELAGKNIPDWLKDVSR